MNFAGLNLTVPHKLLALEMVDQLDASAIKAGAVNTIKFEKGGDGKTLAIGFNTDSDAIVTSLREDLKIKLPGAKVLLLGAGGAGADGGAENWLRKMSRNFFSSIARRARPRKSRRKSANNFRL